MSDAEDFVLAFLTAIEKDEVIGNEGRWYTEDTVQVEWPNKLLPAGTVRTVATRHESALPSSILPTGACKLTEP